MAYPHIETKEDYALYKEAVAEFFEREKISNLSSGHIFCPECETPDFFDKEVCPNCRLDRDCANESFFSWFPCDCCGRDLGGNREYATGWNPEAEEIQEYTVCEDCIYYAEYGQLDDLTMWTIEENEK